MHVVLGDVFLLCQDLVSKIMSIRLSSLLNNLPSTLSNPPCHYSLPLSLLSYILPTFSVNFVLKLVMSLILHSFAVKKCKKHHLLYFLYFLIHNFERISGFLNFQMVNPINNRCYAVGLS